MLVEVNKLNVNKLNINNPNNVNNPNYEEHIEFINTKYVRRLEVIRKCPRALSEEEDETFLIWIDNEDEPIRVDSSDFRIIRAAMRARNGNNE